MTTPTSAPSIPRNPAPLCQLSEPTKDSNADENASENCGETALAWVVRDIGNEPDADGDEIHDEVIGQGVIGGSDLLDAGDPSGNTLNPRYVAAATKRGVQLTLYRGSQAQLVAKCHEVMGYPAGDVLVNVPGGNHYLQLQTNPTGYGGFGHIVVIAHSIASGLEGMDPWVGATRDFSDATWQQLIVWGYIVICTPSTSPTTGGTVLSITDPTVSPYYSLQSNGSWLCKSNNISIQSGILAFYITLPFSSTGLPKSGELYPIAGIAVQVFERCVIVYDPARKFDAPPGATGNCYLGHIDSGAALAFLTSAVSAQLTAVQAAQAHAQADLASAQQQLATAQQALKAAQAQAAADAKNAQQQLIAAQQTGQDATAKAQAAQTALDAANQQVAALTAQLSQAQADGAKGLVLMQALKAALA